MSPFLAAVGDRPRTGEQQGYLRKAASAEDILSTCVEHNNGGSAWYNKGACW